MESFYYNKLGKQEQRIYQQMKNGIESLAESFEVERAERERLGDIFSMIRLDHPEIFYVSNFKYSYYPDSNLVKMKPEYLFDKNKIKDHKIAMKSRVEKLSRPVQDKSDWEKECYIHDFICENVTYDKLKKQYSHEIIGPLGHGVGVCEGIAKAVKVLCDAMKIPCIVVLSENNPEKKIKYRHAWNIIQIQGSWYHLDATFDNTLSKNQVRYDYFNLEDKKIFRDHEPLIYPAPICSSGELFYYREKKLSFTKMEDVKKRCLQAIRKDKILTFHWRGGYLTREVIEELAELIEKTAAEKERCSVISLNYQQAVLSIRFPQEQRENTVNMEDIYEEENMDS